MAKKANRLNECVADKRATHIVSKPLREISDKFIDFDFLESQLASHNNKDEEWFADKRIGNWSEFVQTLTSKDLSRILE